MKNLRVWSFLLGVFVICSFQNVYAAKHEADIYYIKVINNTDHVLYIQGNETQINDFVDIGDLATMKNVSIDPGTEISLPRIKIDGQYGVFKYGYHPSCAAIPITFNSNPNPTYISVGSYWISIMTGGDDAISRNHEWKGYNSYTRKKCKEGDEYEYVGFEYPYQKEEYDIISYNLEYDYYDRNDHNYHFTYGVTFEFNSRDSNKGSNL